MTGVSFFRFIPTWWLWFFLFQLINGPLNAQKTQFRFANLGLDQGLSQVSVNAVLQDQHGFIWVGTRDGLNRFDGYHCRIWKNVSGDADSLSGNWIQAMAQDREGGLWVATVQGGLDRFDPRTEHFQRYEPELSGARNQAVEITALYADPAGSVWIGTRTNGLLRYLPETNETQAVPLGPNSQGGKGQITALSPDSEGAMILWVGTADGLVKLDLAQDPVRPAANWFAAEGGAGESGDGYIRAVVGSLESDLFVAAGKGIYRYDKNSALFHELTLEGLAEPNGTRVTALARDRLGILWVGTNSGLLLWDESNGQTRWHRNIPKFSASLANDRVTCLLEDTSGLMWIGTAGAGLSRYRPTPFKFYTNDPQDPASPGDSSIRAILRDGGNQLWLGTWYQGLDRFDPEADRFVHYRHDPADPRSLGSNTAVGPLLADRQGNLLIGHSQGLDLLDRETGTFQHLLVNQEDQSGQYLVETLYQDPAGILWVGIRGQGLFSLSADYQLLARRQHDPEDPQSLPHDHVRQISPNQQQGLWIATFGGGLSSFDPESGRFTPIRPPGQGQNLDHLLCLHLEQRDLQQNLWLGTWGQGLCLFQPEQGRFRYYRERDGLPNDVVYGILPDDLGAIWLSTNKGLARFQPENGQVTSYDVNDGLQSSEFNQGAWFKAGDGTLYFGGVNGYNAFNPSEVHRESWLPPVLITDFLLANVSLLSNREDRASPLSLAVHETRSLTLGHRQSPFSFEFAALDYGAPQKLQYAWRMLGLSDEWIKTHADRRFATFTQLPPGHYRFQVKASNRDGVWNPDLREMAITIQPPLWLSWWAFLGYGLILVALVTLTILTLISRAERLRQLEKERDRARHEHMAAEQLRRVDKLKDEFMANTSHELRTPLNGIIGVAEALIDGVSGPLPPQSVENLSLIVDSAKRLSSLVNDILDFSKLKNNSLELHPQPIDLHRMTEIVFSLSRPLIGHKQVELINQVDPQMGPIEADRNRIQQILHNLIGNAIKFTDQGQVTISATPEEEQVRISVQDTGIGIARDKWEVIFDSFEQGDGSIAKMHGGTGLGLAISRRLVALHGGRIWLDSVEDQGTIFYFTLPLAHHPENALEPEPTTLNRVQDLSSNPDELALAVKTLDRVEGDFHILIIDDEPVNRKVLANFLTPWEYRISEAEDGTRALELLQEHQFDLVLLDIMMPRLSGYEVCQRLRQRFSVNELPIILLTARNQITDLVQGFVAGANDYITKPISKYELLSRVKTHLQLLDAHRHLEQKVRARTIELEQRNFEILRRQKQLIMQEKMASLGTLTAGVAHEMKNPLNFVNNFSTLSVSMLRELSEMLANEIATFEPEIREDVEEIMEDLASNLTSISDHGRRADQIIQSMMDIVGGEAGKRRPTDLNALVDKFTKMAWHGMKAKYPNVQVAIEQEYDAGVGVFELDPRGISRVLINLVNNALEALTYRTRTENETYAPVLTIRTQKLEDRVLIQIKDNGCGIPKNQQERIFNPFFTTKPAGSGHIGLGLYTSYDIVVREHQGDLKVTSQEGRGCSITVVLPVRSTLMFDDEYYPQQVSAPR